MYFYGTFRKNIFYKQERVGINEKLFTIYRKQDRHREKTSS